MKTLVELFEEQGDTTDKITVHKYGYLYDELLGPAKYEVKSLLEIGIAKGGSIRVWQEYFEKAKIYAIDIEPFFVDKVKELDRVEAFVLDAGNKIDLEWFATNVDDIDVIIDDGSHKVFDIVMAFAILWRIVTPGGIYIIEDAWQTNDNLSLLNRFYNVGMDAISNCSDILSVEFRPNMIVLTKKEENDVRCPPKGTL